MNDEDLPFDFKIESGYIRFIATGVMDRSRYEEFIQFMEKKFHENEGLVRCVVDLRDAISRINEIDRFELAKMSAAKLAKRKMATVIKSSMVPSNLYENATNNRGFETFVTDTMETAIKWVLEKQRITYF